MIPDLLLVAVDFYKDPRRFPHFREGTGPLPPGITELLDGASALLAEGRREEVSATLGVSPEELEAALRFFVKEVMLRAGDHPARILGVPADADLALIKKHYRHLMSLFHPDKDTAGEGWDALYAPKITEAYSILRKQAGPAGETQDPEHTSSTGASQAPMQPSTWAASEDDLSPWGTEAAGQRSPSPGDRMSPQVPNSPQPQPIFSDGPDRHVMAGLVRLGLMRLANVPRVAVYSGVGSLMLLVALGLWIVKPSTPELTLAGGAPSAPTTTGTVKLDVAEPGAMGSGAVAMQSGNAMAAATTKPLTGDALKARVEERVLAAAASADQSTPIVQQGPAAATEATLSADQPAKDSRLRAAVAALAATSTPSMTPEPAPGPEPVQVAAVEITPEPAIEPEPVMEPAPVEEPAPVVAVTVVETPPPEPEPAPVMEPEAVVEAAVVVAVAAVETPSPESKPAPVIEPEPIEEPAPVAVAVLEPVPEPASEPVTEPGPVVEAAPIAVAVVASPAPTVDPEPIAAPTPVAEPEPIPEPTPVAEPAPVVAVTVVETPPPEPELAPVVEPEAVVKAAPVVAVTVVETPPPEPKPAPVMEPEPIEEPAPVAVAALEPVPEPAPALEPDPIPEPEPVVAVATVEPASVGEPSFMVDSGPLDDPAFKIQELVARIEQAYEQEDAKAFAALFTDEGDATDVTGREAIYAYYEEYFSRTNIDRFRLVFMTWEAQGEGVFAIDSNVEIWIRPKDDRPEVRTKIPITWKVAALEQSYFVDRMEY